jgi:catechol 2,3-dioxygenase-like lactoylglutathione lyase family enzyme
MLSSITTSSFDKKRTIVLLSEFVEVDHVTLPVRDYEAAKAFYARLLAPLGFQVLLDWPDKRRAYLGRPGEPSSLWLREWHTAGSLELSLAVGGRDAVNAFHEAAVAAGAATVEEPGVRPELSERYYAARAFDPDGNSVEVVHRAAAEQQLAA